MILKPVRYYAKILLFGEYILLAGSKALTIPFPQFGGSIEIPESYSENQNSSNKSLKGFLEYLKIYKADFPPGLKIDLDRFESELNEGLYLNSDIPQGCGVGSSGVVVASVYARFAINPIVPKKKSDLIVLKKYFSFMESYFHGRSSGLDPLSSYTGIPLLFFSPEKIEKADFALAGKSREFAIFLLDTGVTSGTEGLVQVFLEKMKNSTFRKVMENKIIPGNNKCIESILKGEINSFFHEMKIFSSLQLEYFGEMIPEKYKNVWEHGIKTGHYYLKMCGSGGGGFILGFTRDYKNAKDFFDKHGIRFINVDKALKKSYEKL